MGILTLQNFRDDLTSALGRSGISNTLLDRWVNLAVKEFGYAFKFHELEGSSSKVMVVGQYTYTITGDFGIIDFRATDEVNLYDTDSTWLTRLRRETRSAFKSANGDGNAHSIYGQPTKYHRYGGAVHVRIPPDKPYVLAMDYLMQIPLMVNSGDVSFFQPDWDEVIFTGALWRGFRNFREFDQYQNVRADFLGMVRSRQTELELEEFPFGSLSPTAGDAPEDVEAD